jgi:hypothetical protein
MPKRTITQLFLDRITPPKTGRVEYWDTHRRGLCLRVSASGAKTWATTYRVRGKQVRETLGTLAAIPKVDEARRRAHASMERARVGVNPVEERRTATARTAANIVAGAVARYLDRCERDLRPATVRGYRQLFEHDVLPRWACARWPRSVRGTSSSCSTRRRSDATVGAGCARRGGRPSQPTADPAEDLLRLVRRERPRRRRPHRRRPEAGQGGAARPGAER